ncbi:MAG TPA: hypothetical protein VG672_00420 [Bryobacteraceae bacterium]|jgi:proteasome lid subunit RPN8/RPN11|nr:hypothetical protein [Bryobacteraceae bacterium]
MAERLNPVSPEIWRVPECPFTIEYDADLLDEIRRLAVNAYHSLPHGGAEIGGVLFGTRQSGLDGDHLRIRTFRPIECQYAFGPSFVLSEKDRQGLAKLLESALFDAELDSLLPLGWYHTHTRSDVFLSDKDLELHDRFFPEPWQFALVIRPHTLEPSRAGFFFRDAEGQIRTDRSYHEIPLRPRRRRTPPPAEEAVEESAEIEEAPREMPPREMAPRELASREMASREMEDSPEDGDPLPLSSRPELRPFRVRREDLPPERTHSSPWLIIFLAILSTLAVGAVSGFVGFWMASQRQAAVASATPPISPALHLRAAEINGQLHIEWDRTAPPVQTAQSAYLEILDGNAKSVVLLDPARLRGGAFTYARQAEQVFIHLILQQPEGRTIQEGTGFVGRLEGRKEESGPSEVELQLREENQSLQRQLDQERRKTRDLAREVEIQRQLLRRR